MLPESFYRRREWIDLRYRVLRKYGYRCMACGATRSNGVTLHVDHIKPVSLFPEFALVEENLQVLCEACNLGKSNRYDDDFRPIERPVEIKHRRPLRQLSKQHRRALAGARLSNLIKRRIGAAESSGDRTTVAALMRDYLNVMRKMKSLTDFYAQDASI